jgi:hypothetical protein
LRIVPANQTAPIVPINGKINPAESFSNGIQGILHIVQMKPIAISYSVNLDFCMNSASTCSNSAERRLKALMSATTSEVQMTSVGLMGKRERSAVSAPKVTTKNPKKFSRGPKPPRVCRKLEQRQQRDPASVRKFFR